MSGKNTTSMQNHARKVLAHQQSQQPADADAEPGSDIALPDPAFMAPDDLTVLRHVTVPVLQLPLNSPIICKIRDAVHRSDIEDSRYPDAANVCQIEAPSGDVRVLIIGTVLGAALDREYPDQTYVGRWFRIAKLQRVEKRYADYAIAEIASPLSAAA